MQNRVIELESVRGLAALLVVLTHIPNWYSPFHQIFFIRNGGLAVELFFVLSGFVIYSTYSRQIVNFKDLIRFQFLRFGRLYPLHLLFLLMFVGFEFLKLAFIKDPVSPPFANGVAGPREFLENLTLTQALGFSIKPDSFNSPSWSISTEFYTYLIFAFIAMIFTNWQLAIHVTLFVLLSLILVIAPYEIAEFFRLIICVAGFSLGCLVAIVTSEILKRNWILPGLVGFIAFVTLALFIAGASSDGNKNSLIIFFLSGVLIISIVCGDKGVLRRLLQSNLLVGLGKYSYSIYMSHWAVIYMADVIVKRSNLISWGTGEGLDMNTFCIVIFWCSCR